MNLKVKLTDTVRSGILGAAVTVVLGLILFAFRIGQPLESLSYDVPFAFVQEDVTNEVVIVKMDDASRLALDETYALWKRRTHARLLDKLKSDGSGLVVFDVLLADPGNDADNAELARAIKAHGNVVLAATPDVVPRPQFPGIQIQPPLPMFREGAKGWGLTDVAPDFDLVIRRHYPGTEEFPSIHWKAAQLAGASIAGTPEERMSPRWIRYYGTNGTITTIGYNIALEEPAGFFKGKTVFVGGKPRTLNMAEPSDLFSTPYTRWTGGRTHGVEIQVTMFLNLVRGDWLSRLSMGKELGAVLLAGLLFGCGLTLVRPLPGAGLALAGALAVGAGAVWLFWNERVWFSWLVIAGAQIPCAWTCGLIAHTVRVDREKRTLAREKSELEIKLSTGSVAPGLPQPVLSGAAAKGARVAVEIPDHELLRCIGGGAYGEVWLARNAIGTYHAVKIVHEGDFSTNESYAREFKGIQKYMPVSRRHPGLVQVLHVGRKDEGGYYYCIMEPGDDEVSGTRIDPATYSPRNLAKDIRKRGRLPVQECVSLILQLTDALGFLHDQQLLHRDIKPSNIIFVNGQPKLADIGLVTEFGVRDKEPSAIGTEGYMAPERPLTAASDIFSLGMVIWEAGMGRDPDAFPALPTSFAERADAAPLRRLNDIILKAREIKVSRRYQTAAELRADLQELQARFWQKRA